MIKALTDPLGIELPEERTIVRFYEFVQWAETAGLLKELRHSVNTRWNERDAFRRYFNGEINSDELSREIGVDSVWIGDMIKEELGKT